MIGAPAQAGDYWADGRARMTVAPWFSPALWSASQPPINSASRRAMLSPRPLPPKRRVELPSAWLNGWKS